MTAKQATRRERNESAIRGSIDDARLAQHTSQTETYSSTGATDVLRKALSASVDKGWRTDGRLDALLATARDENATLAVVLGAVDGIRAYSAGASDELQRIGDRIKLARAQAAEIERETIKALWHRLEVLPERSEGSLTSATVATHLGISADKVDRLRTAQRKAMLTGLARQYGFDPADVKVSEDIEHAASSRKRCDDLARVLTSGDVAAYVPTVPAARKSKRQAATAVTKIDNFVKWIDGTADGAIVPADVDRVMQALARYTTRTERMATLTREATERVAARK